MKNKLDKYMLVSKAYTTMKRNDKDISILDTDVVKDIATQNAILDIQRELNTAFELSYEIMADACSILAELGSDRVLDNGKNYDIDFWAEADSRANVYTAVQLSYLSLNNEIQISELMKDESITSIAQACSIWYSQKVAEACQALSDYITQ